MGTSKNKTYASALAFRSALDERARRSQRDTGESVQLVRRRYAFEAFLRRIPRSGQPLVLKGGYLMQLRYAEGTRLTKDLDAALRDEALSTQPPEVIAQRLQAALLAVAEVPDVDFFTFDISDLLHEKVPGSTLDMVPDGGHSSSELAIAKAFVEANERLRRDPKLLQRWREVE